MNILILSSPPHENFVIEHSQQNSENHSFLIKCYGEYDWSENYDIGISFMHLYKVPKEQLSKPWFNFHPGLLPAYRGRDVCYHAIMNGETEFGATLHYMDENFDTGEIIGVRKFEIENWMTAGDLSQLTMLASQSLFTEYLPRILAGENFATTPNTGGNYYRKTPINDSIEISEKQAREIRAITCGDFFPKINVGGVAYKIVRSE